MHSPSSILKKYWSFENFRPNQEEIIKSVLDGKDTLALLPTGGGKSICFQVPALCSDGICIVVSPLIALMQDQVENLNARGIKAIAITSVMSKKEVDVAFDNCVYGDLKFLYLSPERLQTEMARIRISKMNVNLFAIDEAHCISQWGYDFRPPYLQVAALREIHPHIPVLALTATATLRVVDDIQEKLLFKKKNVFRSSFARTNLAYTIRKTENKIDPVVKLSSTPEGSGIVYVRSRRRTREISDFLKRKGIASSFYHAGLPAAERITTQKEWLSGKSKVIVATNAFGMGIDKANVRFVAHLDLPDSPEAYFQEAGRAGRDGKLSYAALFWQEKDIEELERNHKLSFPSLTEIRRAYQSIANFFQVAIGSGNALTLVFDQQKICESYKLDPAVFFHCIKFLEREGYIAVNDAVYTPARLKFLANNDQLYNFQVQNPAFDKFIKTILRSYGGLFDEYVRIREKDIARKTSLGDEEVKQKLFYLDKLDLLHYIPQNDKPMLTFIQPRADAKKLFISPENLSERKKIAEERLRAMIRLVSDERNCRQKLLLRYFGEENSSDCGICDVCRKKSSSGKKAGRNDLAKIIVELLSQNPKNIRELPAALPSCTEEDISFVVRQLLDSGKIKFNTKRHLVVS
ncbi:MAG: RecQ family ATP-dependent DNA helicase [Bacteroidetes bacterium]|nr:RecQ family ATP-dependent DNA helicase [Bacteroidota bacterium]